MITKPRRRLRLTGRTLVNKCLIGFALSCAALCSPNAFAFVDGANRTLSQWGSFGEWTLANPSFSGNPFDVEASATFRHTASGTQITTQMYYAGDNEWKFRFTATLTGEWQLTTSAADADLDGWNGQVNVPNRANRNGFVGQSNNSWVHGATGEALLPNYVMYAGPHYFRTNTALIDADINRFLDTHGFTGFHIPVYCRWFDINTARCSEVSNSDPDMATFAALETIIERVYARGGVVHIWAWGDSGRQQNVRSLNSQGGINGTADRRLQRYLAARLGPLPGWTMGYGYDLFEWVNGNQLTQWHDRMQDLFGWRHMLGARSNTNSFGQLSEAMDYSSYETFEPTYDLYRTSFTQRASKPSFSEDRFRFRGNDQRSKDYTFDQMRLGMWDSVLAGGVANIWGNLTLDNGVTYDEGINEAIRPSNSFPNAAALRTFATFFENRFEAGMVPCNGDADGLCQRLPNNSARTVFARSTSNIDLDLRSMTGSINIRAVDTERAYSEVDMGNFSASNVTVNLPYNSDWALAIGWESSTTAAPPPPTPTPPPPPTPTPPPPTPTPPPAPTPTPTPPPSVDTIAPQRVENISISGLESDQ